MLFPRAHPDDLDRDLLLAERDADRDLRPGTARHFGVEQGLADGADDAGDPPAQSPAFDPAGQPAARDRGAGSRLARRSGAAAASRAPAGRRSSRRARAPAARDRPSPRRSSACRNMPALTASIVSGARRPSRPSRAMPLSTAGASRPGPMKVPKRRRSSASSPASCSSWRGSTHTGCQMFAVFSGILGAPAQRAATRLVGRHVGADRGREHQRVERRGVPPLAQRARSSPTIAVRRPSWNACVTTRTKTAVSSPESATLEYSGATVASP